jgi:hypothetical protein
MYGNSADETGGLFFDVSIASHGPVIANGPGAAGSQYRYSGGTSDSFVTMWLK